MSKRFLRQIGFMALLIFVSNITPQSTNAMRRATLDDYKADERMCGKSMTKKMHEYAENNEGVWGNMVSSLAAVIGVASAFEDQSHPIGMGELYTAATADYRQKLVCKHKPRQHSIVDANGMTNSQIEKIDCPDCR